MDSGNLKVSISQVPAGATPASMMMNLVVEELSTIMVLCGIETISTTRYSSGYADKLHVSIAPFADAPERIKAQGIIAKDAIAKIMSLANVSRIAITPTDDDLKAIKANWADSIARADAQDGSSQVEQVAQKKPENAEPHEPQNAPDPDEGADFHMNIATRK